MALEAAKRARDRGSNVQIARRALLEARTAFEAGNYGVATERADYVLGLFESGPAHPAMPANATSTGGPPESTDAESARIWIRQATGSIQEAKARGLNVHVRYQDREWTFPHEDCVLLPIANTTAELLGRYIGQRLLEVLRRDHVTAWVDGTIRVDR